MFSNGSRTNTFPRFCHCLKCHPPDRKRSCCRRRPQELKLGRVNQVSCEEVDDEKSIWPSPKTHHERNPPVNEDQGSCVRGGSGRNCFPSPRQPRRIMWRGWRGGDEGKKRHWLINTSTWRTYRSYSHHHILKPLWNKQWNIVINLNYRNKILLKMNVIVLSFRFSLSLHRHPHICLLCTSRFIYS